MVAPIVLGLIVTGTAVIGGGILGWNLKKSAPASTVTGSASSWLLDNLGLDLGLNEVLLIAGGLLAFLFIMNRINNNTAGVVIVS